MQSQAAIPFQQQLPRGNSPHGSNKPNVPRGLQFQHSMSFTPQPSERNSPPGSSHPRRATLPSAYWSPSQPVPISTTSVAAEERYSASPPDLMFLPEPVVDYHEPQFEQQLSYQAPAQDHTLHHPHEQLPPSGYGSAYFQGQQHHPQMIIPQGLSEHREVGVILPQSTHTPVSPQQHLSPVSPAPLPGHAPSPTRPPLYQSQTAPPSEGSGTQGQVPYPPSSTETTFPPISQGDNDNELISGIFPQLQAELVAYTVPDDHKRVTQSHDLAIPTSR